jgi:hypothetical protein
MLILILGVLGFDRVKLTIPPPLINSIDADTFFHLFDLKTNKSGIRIAIAVILGQESNSLFVTSLGHEPTRRLGDKPYGANNNEASEALADEGNSPLVIVADKVATVCDSGGGNGTTKPTTVVETYHMCQKE